MSTPAIAIPPTGSWIKQSETLLSFGMIIGLVVMLVPLPQWLLDLLLAAT
jgi:flagellar biosynthesis component FlhA